MAKGLIPPVVLIILDGWGVRPESDCNAIAMAHTPVMDSLWATYPHTQISASGRAVGLPSGQMGNSEVGHLNIGAGRIVPQELVRISDAVEDGSIADNPAMIKICQDVQARQGKLHLMGLCSDGGVHSHLDHLYGLLKMAKQRGIQEVCIHAIMDGRDTNPKSGIEFIRQLEEQMAAIGIGQIVTISGRYYAMDRDKRWERVEKAYRVMTLDGEGDGRSATQILEDSYETGVNDEFIIPTRIINGAVKADDGVIFFNFRPDRSRQLTQALVDPDFNSFQRDFITPITFVSFTQYDPKFTSVLVAFHPQNLDNILGEVIAQHGLKQLRTAETEKYAHVTYFFNGGLEQPFVGEDRELIPSPNVATYDLEPAMSAQIVTDGVIEAIEKGIYSLVVINYANPDMVGHTGMMDAAIQAINTVDQCLGKLLSSIGKMGGTSIIIADHGNAEYMCDAQGNPWTAHTTNPVPFILVEGEKLKIPGHGANVALRENGCLADVAPTILEILNLPQPPEMTGKSMIDRSKLEVNQDLSPVGVGI